jgi:hypothetical protein
MASIHSTSGSSGQELMRPNGRRGMQADTLSTYFELVDETWSRAGAGAQTCFERHYSIAGLTVRLQFAGPALLPLITAGLAHLELGAAGEKPVLTARLWDCASTNVVMPPAPIRVEDFTIRGELNGFSDDRYHVAYDALGRILSLYDKARGLGWFCAHDATIVPTHERGAPLRWILSWLMQNHERQVVHAASIGGDKGGLLIVGRGGAGKSNTSVGCMLSGLNFAGDDFCAVSIEPRPIAYSLYSSTKLRASDWVQLPLPRANLNDPETEKNLYYLQPYYAEKIKPSIPLLAIVMPIRSSARAASFERISPRIPLVEMASQSISMLPHSGAEMVTMLSSLVRRLPCYRFHLGHRPMLIPAAISDLIRALGKEDDAYASHG